VSSQWRGQDSSGRQPKPRLTLHDVACWLIKSSVPPAALVPGWTAGEERTVRRCLRPSYRLDLMAVGQPCVLWVSGSKSPGVHAVGWLATDPVVGGDDRPTVDIVVRLLPEPVRRDALVGHLDFADAEVLRMPAGSNPSYLTGPQWGVVQDALAPVRPSP
jgi:hypothetical protein